jgi:hypothetical protein
MKKILRARQRLLYLQVGICGDQAVPRNLLRILCDGRNRRVCFLTIALACLTVLSACAGISTVQLNNIGSKIYPVSLNFSEIHTYAERSAAAYGSASSIKQSYPQIVRLNSPGNADVLYFLEQDDRHRIHIITIRGTHNDQNWAEDLSFTVREDRPIAIPVHAGFDRVTRPI